MKHNLLLVLSVLAFGLQGVAQATPFPADAEASYHLTALDTYADQLGSLSWNAIHSRGQLAPVLVSRTRNAVRKS